MSTLTVRNIPEPVYERLREQAGRNRRSMSSEIVMLLEQALMPEPLATEALIAEIQAFRARFPEPLPDLIAEGKRAGRKDEHASPAPSPSGTQNLPSASS